MTPQEALRESWHRVFCRGRHDSLARCEYRDGEVVWAYVGQLIAALPEGWVLTEVQPVLDAGQEAYLQGQSDGAQQERERLRGRLHSGPDGLVRGRKGLVESALEASYEAATEYVGDPEDGITMTDLRKLGDLVADILAEPSDD